MTTKKRLPAKKRFLNDAQIDQLVAKQLTAHNSDAPDLATAFDALVGDSGAHARLTAEFRDFAGAVHQARATALLGRGFSELVREAATGSVGARRRLLVTVLLFAAADYCKAMDGSFSGFTPGEVEALVALIKLSHLLDPRQEVATERFVETADSVLRELRQAALDDQLRRPMVLRSVASLSIAGNLFGDAADVQHTQFAQREQAVRARYETALRSCERAPRVPKLPGE